MVLCEIHERIRIVPRTVQGHLNQFRPSKVTQFRKSSDLHDFANEQFGWTSAIDLAAANLFFVAEYSWNGDQEVSAA